MGNKKVTKATIISMVDADIGPNNQYLLEVARVYDVQTDGLTYAQIRKAIIEAVWQQYKDGLLMF